MKRKKERKKEFKYRKKEILVFFDKVIIPKFKIFSSGLRGDESAQEG